MIQFDVDLSADGDHSFSAANSSILQQAFSLISMPLYAA